MMTLSESAPGGQGEITEARIMTALEKNAREEEEMWRNIRRDPAAYSQLPEEDDQLTLMFNICTTKKGSVYHSFPTCGYLQAVQAGPRRESRWCPLCRYVARHGCGRPPPGVSVWMSGLGGIASLTRIHDALGCMVVES